MPQGHPSADDLVLQYVGVQYSFLNIKNDIKKNSY
jgi:hypothetical protein